MPTFQTPEPIAVAVDIMSGDVTVVASDRADTVVEVRPADAAEKSDVRAAAETSIQCAAGTVTVQTRKSWRTRSPFGGSSAIQVRIEVPAGSSLRGTVGLGSVLGSGDLGDCDLEVATGEIVIERPRGSVTAKIAEGDIRIGEAVRGELRLETSVGELAVGIRPGSAARLETDAVHGTVQNLLAPADSHGVEDMVRVYARNMYGNIVIAHSVAA